jgi:predicted HNH restriction endonuclease
VIDKKVQPNKEFKVMQWKSAESDEKGNFSIRQHDQNRISGINVKSSFTVNSNEKHSNLRMLCLESDLELNTKVIEAFLSFSMAIDTASIRRTNQNYDRWKLSVTYWKFQFEQKEMT